MADQHSKAVASAELHRSGTFVAPHPWDAGSARMLSRHGLTADPESRYGESHEDVADMIRRAAEVGPAGASIEDATGEAGRTIRDVSEAVDRVVAAVEAAREQPFPFTLTARADNFFHGCADLDHTIRRLQAFAEGGADVLYAPALPSLDAVRAVCSSLDKPVNVLAAGPVLACSVTELGALGVRRISLGPALLRVALTAMLAAAAELAERGTLGFLNSAPHYAESNASVGRS